MNKMGEWIVYLKHENIYFAVGKYPKKTDCIKAAYLALVKCIDDCESNGSIFENIEYLMSSPYFLEGGDDMGINLYAVKVHDDGVVNKDSDFTVKATAHILEILEDDD